VSEPGGTIEVRVERMAPEGQGLARAEGSGRVVFVPCAAPGDRLRVVVESVQKGYALARAEEVLEPGPDRVEPSCPLHAAAGRSGRETCGGCGWQHLSLAGQLAAKRSIVEDCLRRIGRIQDVPVEETLPSPRPTRYRNKVLVPFGRAAGRPVAGFYAPGSHRIADFQDCLVQPELSVRVVLEVKRLCGELGWEPYDVSSHSGWLRHLFVRTSEEGRALAALVTLDPSFPKRDQFVAALRAAVPEVCGVLRNIQPHRTSVVLGREWEPVWGETELEERVGSLRLRAGPEAFLQVNTPASEALYGLVSEMLFGDGWRPALAVDLYCGVGSIALWLASRADEVLGIEENRRAVEDARRNAALNGVQNARFAAGRVETALGTLRAALGPTAAGTACVVLDPPRAGCSIPVLKALRDPALARLAYVSCNPATFARDASRLAKSGWKLARLKPVDMFPQTSHVEIAALFLRG